MRRSVTLLVLGVSALAGCSDSGANRTPTPPPARTVAYFLEHPDEHDAVKRQCKNDPGALRNTPDCVNADQAQKQIFVWGFDEAARRSREGH